MRFVYLKADLKSYCSSLIKSRVALVMKRMDVFREMTLIICSGNCLQECELKHLSVLEGPRWLDLYTYCTGSCARPFDFHEMTFDPMCV